METSDSRTIDEQTREVASRGAHSGDHRITGFEYVCAMTRDQKQHKREGLCF